MAEHDEPTYAHPIIGFRSWKVNQQQHLTGIAHASVWRPDRPKVSDCGRGHIHPVGDCGCGLYAYYQLKDTHQGYPIVGVVIGKGHTELHQKGFRTEEAVIVAVAPSKTKHQALAQQIASTYNVPCVTIDQLETIATQYGEIFNWETFNQQQQQIPSSNPFKNSPLIKTLTNIATTVTLMFLAWVVFVTFNVAISDLSDMDTIPVKEKGTGKVLPDPSPKLFTAVHGNEGDWHVAPLKAWRRPQDQQWLMSFAVGSGASIPLTARTQTQQLQWARDVLIHHQQGSQSNRRLFTWTINILVGIIVGFCLLMFAGYGYIKLYERWQRRSATRAANVP